MNALKRSLSSILSASLFLAGPGLSGTQAFAAQQSSGPRGGQPVPAVAVSPAASAVPALPGLQLSPSPDAGGRQPDAPGLDGLSGARSAVPSLSLAAPESRGPEARAAAPSAAPERSSQAASAPAPAGPAAASRAAAVGEKVSVLIEKTGDIGRAEPGAARGLGQGLETAITGEDEGFRDAWDLPAPAPAKMGGLQGGVYMAKPAGQSISEAARAFSAPQSAAPSGPAVPAPPRGPGSSGDGPSGKSRGPFWPRLLSAGIALSPAVLLGAPLVVSGAALAGGLVIAASAGIALLPFMSSAWPQAARSAPGVLVAALGLGTLALSLPALSGAGMAMGALVALGGWGLARFARSPEKFDRWDGRDALASFFGAFGSVAGAGLVLLHPAGLVLGALTVLSFVGPLPLFIHLPGWVGQSMKAGLEGFFASVKDAVQAATSVRRDTLLFDRLSAFTRASYKRSAWNALWLGAVVWLPVIAVEAAKIVLGAAVGLALGAARLIPMLLWGASHELKADSAPTKFFAAWARRQFAESKGVSFNRLEKRLIPAANSKSLVVSRLGALAILALQLGWLAYVLVRAPLALAWGFLTAFGATGEAYDPAKHDPDRLRLADERDGLPARQHEEPGDQPGGPVGPVLAKLLAGSAALLPAYFLTVPVLLESSVIVTGLFVVASLTTALMPLMPGSSRFPMRLRKIPGTLLTLAGLSSLILVPWSSSLGLNVNGVASAVVAALAGLGLRNYAEKLAARRDDGAFPVDGVEYIGGFVGALGALLTMALGVVGVSGSIPVALAVAGYGASALLLAHLPKWLWVGVGTAMEGVIRSVSAAYKVMSFWHREARFTRNMSRWYNSWLKESVWHGAWLWVPWLAVSLGRLLDGAVSLGAGLAAGLASAPAFWAWGAAYEANPDGRLARYTAGAGRSLLAHGIGSKDVFDAWTARLRPAIDEAATNGRPTFKAVAALAAARLLQLAWLLRLLVWLPVIVGRAHYDGLKNMEGGKAPVKDRWSDPDRPRF